jgi:hypothetical protein
MLESTPWRELHRSNDPLAARAVATAIAAMEFDVRTRGVDESDDESSDLESAGPFVIEVPSEHWFALADVLGEIIDEQREFDEALVRRADARRSRIVLVLGIATFAELVALWRLMEP